MQDLGNLKKIVCTAEVEEKTCKCSIDGGKNLVPPRNHDTPLPPGGNNGPSLMDYRMQNLKKGSAGLNLIFVKGNGPGKQHR